MRKYRNAFMVALTVGLLAVAGAAVADCGAEHAKAGSDQMVSLQGCLSQDMDGNFRLIEQESGESITLEASEDVRIDNHVGQTVKVTGAGSEKSGAEGDGAWGEDEGHSDESETEYGSDAGTYGAGGEHNRSFKVSQIETVSETCES